MYYSPLNMQEIISWNTIRKWGNVHNGQQACWWPIYGELSSFIGNTKFHSSITFTRTRINQYNMRYKSKYHSLIANSRKLQNKWTWNLEQCLTDWPMTSCVLDVQQKGISKNVAWSGLKMQKAETTGSSVCT